MAKRMKCSSNLRQIHFAINSYLSSNSDTYPCVDGNDPLPKKNSTDPSIWLWMGRGWRGFIAPYLGGKINADNPSVLLCPADKTAPQKWESTSYSYSLAFYHSPEQIDTMTIDWGKPIAAAQKSVNVARPAEKIIIGEWLSNHLKLPAGTTDSGWWTWAGSRNYLFVDGQVRFLDANDIRPANDGQPNPNLTLHGLKGKDY